MRRAAKVDENQAEIVAALRKVGCTVQSLAAIGNGCPDLLVGVAGKTLLMEVKDGKKVKSKQALTPDQLVWHGVWQGGALAVVDSIDSAIRMVNTTRSEA